MSSALVVWLKYGWTVFRMRRAACLESSFESLKGIQFRRRNLWLTVHHCRQLKCSEYCLKCGMCCTSYCKEWSCFAPCLILTGLNLEQFSPDPSSVWWVTSPLTSQTFDSWYTTTTDTELPWGWRCTWIPEHFFNGVGVTHIVKSELLFACLTGR